MTADELATVDGFPSRSTIHEAIRAGQLPSVRIGRRVYVPVPRLLQMLGVEADGEADV